MIPKAFVILIQVNVTQQVNITLTEADTVNICQGNTTTLHANGANSYLWLPSGNTDSKVSHGSSSICL